MCGIAGIIDPQRSSLEIRETLGRMTDAMLHRGPDDEGFHHQDGVGLGMRRLSIIDVAGGQQPISTEDGQVTVVCNGEIYNFQELQAGLIARGHRFKTGSDTEVIAHLYEEKGSDCLLDLRGMFGLAIWDDRQRRLMIARDRLGKKPLFYACLGDRLLFASEIKAILAAEPSLAELNTQALATYLRFGFVPEPATMFARIRKLPAASYLVHQLERGLLAPRRYWSPDYSLASTPSRSNAEWAEELDGLLEESVRLRLISEVPLGVFLSGGLDSSAMVAYAHRAGLDPLKTFTIGFDRPEWDESADAQLVADHFHTDHHVLQLSESTMQSELAETIFLLARYIDEPFADSSALPMYFVSKLAREHVTVVLSGDGGDELFAGYNAYQGIKFAERYRRLPDWLASRTLPSLAHWAGGVLPGKYRYQAQRVEKVLRDSCLPFQESYYNKCVVCRDSLVSRLLVPEAREQLSDQTTNFPPHIREILSQAWPTQQKQACADLRLRLLEDMLVKVDRMSMANSLEVRSPFLDHKVVEFAAQLPPDVKLRGWEKKAVLRDVMRPQLPQRILRKHKQGFSVPLREWFRHRCHGMLHDLLSPSAGYLPSNYFDNEEVMRLVRAHGRGEADHSQTLWSLLHFAAWHKAYFIDTSCGVAETS